MRDGSSELAGSSCKAKQLSRGRNRTDMLDGFVLVLYLSLRGNGCALYAFVAFCL
jgi:hypothetical protein